MATKDELKARYKELTGEDIDGTNAEIEAAIAEASPAPSETEAEGDYVATQSFRDRITKQMYAEGDKVASADQATTKARLDAKLIKKA